ncbi:hypothetical protein C2G38_2035846 [Gigaspora rosea]|uniref:BTB domain-containing protein n=1 Tax=Gigaspora rosea TaxID=44941 RepID=A0A397VD84_9GLOM|nr:hypothetical protein C2G38_2035846 [Gigaspora rosea]
MAIEFFKKLSSDLTNLLENGEDYNVIIEVDKMSNCQIFKAHSIILSSRCFYILEKLLKTSYNKDNIKKISMPHISANIFEIIIKYIYGGIVLFDKVDASTILNLLVTASEFGLEELVNTAQSQLVMNHASWIRLNFAKVSKIWFECDDFKVLQEFCNDIIAKYPNLRIPEIHDELDAKINALEERFGNIIGARFNDLRDELGAKINVLEERFANILGASFDDLRDEPSYTIRDLYDRLNALEQRSSALEQRSNALEQRVNDTQNSFTTNSLTVNEINVNRWKISYESNVALVCRDMQGNGDKRYAMWNNKHVNL